MLTYKFVVAKGGSLRLRLTNNRRSAEVSMGLKLSEGELEEALSPGGGGGRAGGRRRYLLNVLSQLENLKIELLEGGRRDEDVRVIKGLVMERVFGVEGPRDVSGTNFRSWFMRFADTHLGSGTGTRAGYLHTLSRLEAYCPDLGRMDLGDVTVGWLEGFDAFLARTCRLNSRNHHLRNVRVVMKYAIRHDVDVRNPFDRMRLRTEATVKRSLSVDELRWIVGCEPLAHERVYRDMFVLSFMLIGINPIDLYRLECVDSFGRVVYRRAKTHKLYSVKVEPEAMEIIERYRGVKGLLCLADRWRHHESFASATNKALRKLGSASAAPGRCRVVNERFAGVTLYWARHTWATVAASLDVPKETIAAALGHGGGSVTDIYIDFDRRKVDEANRRVLDWVLYGRR